MHSHSTQIEGQLVTTYTESGKAPVAVVIEWRSADGKTAVYKILGSTCKIIGDEEGAVLVNSKRRIVRQAPNVAGLVKQIWQGA